MTEVLRASPAGSTGALLVSFPTMYATRGHRRCSSRNSLSIAEQRSLRGRQTRSFAPPSDHAAPESGACTPQAKILKLVPLTKPLFASYEALLREKERKDLLDEAGVK